MVIRTLHCKSRTDQRAQNSCYGTGGYVKTSALCGHNGSTLFDGWRGRVLGSPWPRHVRHHGATDGGCVTSMPRADHFGAVSDKVQTSGSVIGLCQRTSAQLACLHMVCARFIDIVGRSPTTARTACASVFSSLDRVQHRQERAVTYGEHQQRVRQCGARWAGGMV